MKSMLISLLLASAVTVAVAQTAPPPPTPVKADTAAYKTEKKVVETTVKTGNHVTKVKVGKTTHEAMQSIELKCGASSIKLDPSGVTIKGPQVSIKGMTQATMKSPMTTVKGDGMLTLKGGVTMIN